MSSYAKLSGIEAPNALLEEQADGEGTDALARALPLTGVRRVLEVGCGTGRLCRAVAKNIGREHAVVGVDASTEHIAFACQSSATDPSPPTFVAVDVADVPIEWTRTFDLVYCKYVLMYSTPRDQGPELLRRMAALARPGGTVACLEPDVNFGADRFPPAPEPLASVLAEIVPYYLRTQGIDWRCGIRLFHTMCTAGLLDIRVSVADGRCIYGGRPGALARHACAHVESLIGPLLRARGHGSLIDTVAKQWRDYIQDPMTFIYNPILMASGRVAD